MCSMESYSLYQKTFCFRLELLEEQELVNAHSQIACLERSEGKIIIDGIDMSTIGLHDLRGNLNIIPQVSCVLEITFLSF